MGFRAPPDEACGKSTQAVLSEHDSEGTGSAKSVLSTT